MLLTSEKIKVECLNFQSRYLFKEIMMRLENPVGFYLDLTFRLQRFSDSTLHVIAQRNDPEKNSNDGGKCLYDSYENR